MRINNLGAPIKSVTPPNLQQNLMQDTFSPPCAPNIPTTSTHNPLPGRIASGVVRVGDRIKVLQHQTGAAVTDSSLKVTRIEKQAGMGKVQLQSAVAGDVVSLAGAGDAAGIADTIAAPAVEQGLDPGPIDPPTLRCVCVC